MVVFWRECLNVRIIICGATDSLGCFIQGTRKVRRTELEKGKRGQLLRLVMVNGQSLTVLILEMSNFCKSKSFEGMAPQEGSHQLRRRKSQMRKRQLEPLSLC